METQTQEQAIVKISGMSCSGCADMIEENISQLDGVQDVAVNLKDSSASVIYEFDKLTSDDFKEAIEASGYGFEGVK